MSLPQPLFSRFVAGFDVEKYSPRNLRRQRDTQSDLDRILDDAALAAGLDRGRWERQAGGDGELVVLPEGADLASAVGRFVSELGEELSVYNEDRVPGMRIRLRVAMHIDVLSRSALGYAGPALVVLSRLLDAPQLRAALRDAPGTPLALLVSEPVYQQVVVSGLRGLRPAEFSEVHVDNPAKGFRVRAYLQVPHASPAERDGGADTGHGPASAPAPAAAGHDRAPGQPVPRRSREDQPGPVTAGVMIHGGVHGHHGPIVGGDYINKGKGR